jgi:hypothetical protein
MAFSDDFLKKYSQITQQNQQIAMMSGNSPDAAEVKLKQKVGGAHTGNQMSHWNFSQPNDVNVIVYDPYTGMAFPSPSHARAYGLSRFVYNLPPGMKVNWSQWQKFAQPEAPQQAVLNAPVADQTVPFEPEPHSPNVYPDPPPPPPPAPEPEPEPTPTPTPSTSAPSQSGTAKSFADWQKRAQELGWSEGSSGRASYQGYLNQNEFTEPSPPQQSKTPANNSQQTTTPTGPKVGSQEWRELHGLTN